MKAEARPERARPPLGRECRLAELDDANVIAELLLPDTLVVQIGNPNGFGVFVTDGTGTTPGN